MFFCASTILARARICNKCGKGQHSLAKFKVWLEIVPIILAVPLFLYSSVQFFKAGEERDASKEALRQASEAIEQVRIVQQKTTENIRALKKVEEDTIAPAKRKTCPHAQSRKACGR